MLRIVVEDTGVGLPFSIEPEKLFNTLSDVDPTFCDSGVQLATAQLIVKALGGTMDIQTEPKKGTRVLLLIPANQVLDISEPYQQTVIDEKPSTPVSRSRKLVVPFSRLVANEDYDYSPKDMDEPLHHKTKSDQVPLDFSPVHKAPVTTRSIIA